MKARIIIIIGIITILGIILRLNNISPFNFYPDAYQNLLVAENIKTYKSVVGFLGKDGMLYPDFVMWSRPFYPILINAATFFVNDSAKSAHIVSFLMGVLTIPLSFFLTKSIFKSNLIGISGAFLVALSFVHTVWSGSIMTETTAVVLMMLFLWRIFSTLERKTKLASMNDFLTGLIFGFAVLTRYEYIFLLIPTIILLILKSPAPHLRILNIFVSFFLVIAVFFSQLYPLRSSFSYVFTQIQDMLAQGGFMLVIGVGIFVGSRIIMKSSKNIVSRFNLIGLIVFWIFAGIILLQLIDPKTFHFGYYDLTSLRSFVRDDLLLSLTFLIGLTILAKKPKYQTHVLFVIISLISLYLIYHRINPEIQRYITHLLPFLLIPASYALAAPFVILRHNQNRTTVLFLLSGALCFLIIMQAFTTFNGIKNWGDGSFARTSYEEKSAKKVSDIIMKQSNNRNIILIASFPEPYYYFSKLSTHSIADYNPFVFIDDSLNNREVVIIQDMGMRDIFPKFSKFIDQHLQKYKIDSFWVKESYHYRTRIEKERYPVILYRIKITELKEIIKKFVI